ncbi:MAG TPA: AsmA family protein, partial [Terriglobia bacterium]|nr:AsmA family protein [Terriglobia bacterium]
MRFPRRLHIRKALIILACLLLAGWLIPPFFHAGRYRKILQTTLESKLGRRVQLGAITLRLLPHPGFSIENVVVEEDPHFGSEPFARVDSVECDLRWRSLFGSRMDCSRIILDHPVFNVVRGPEGRWNVEGIFHHESAGSQPASSLTKARSSPAAPFDFEAEDARVNFTLNGDKKPFALDEVRARFQLDPSQGSIGFSLQGTPVRTDIALLQPPGPVVVTGVWKPAAGPNGALRARLTTSNSLLYAWIPMILHRDPGIYGMVSANILFEGSTASLKINGRMEVAQLHRWESSPPSFPVPVEISFAGLWNRPLDRLQIQRADASFAGSRLHLTGVIGSLSQTPSLNLALAIEQSRLQDLIAVGNNLTKHPTQLAAAGRVDGLLTLQGSWNARRYGGSVAGQFLKLSDHKVEISSRQAEIRVDDQGAHLLPARFTMGSGIEGVAKGDIFPAFPWNPSSSADERHSRRKARDRSLPNPQDKLQDRPHYGIVLTLAEAPLHGVIQTARLWGVGGLRNLDATGTGDVSIRLSGAAWPFTRPQVEAQGHLDSARFLVAGLTEPIRITRFRFELENGAFTAMPVTAGIGDTTFSGWLRRGPAREDAWQFDAKAPRLSLEQASLWFTAIGAQRPAPILSLIPGLRSLESRRVARRDLFSTLDAKGTLECPNVTFHSLLLRDFHAGVTLSGRLARLSAATFRVASGKGSGSATVSFRQAPADISGEFKVTGLRLQSFAQKLPASLSGVRGLLSASGHFTTRGLTRQEMAARLEAKAVVEIRNAALGKFDPLAATAKTASLGVLAPLRGVEIIPSLSVNLIVKNRAVHLNPTRIPLSGAVLAVDGQ